MYHNIKFHIGRGHIVAKGSAENRIKLKVNFAVVIKSCFRDFYNLLTFLKYGM